MAKFRLSSHKLQIELGRQAKPTDRVPPDQRLCKYCTLNECENEIHLVNNCHLVKDLRLNLIQILETKYAFIKEMTSEKFYFWLMSNVDPFVMSNLSKYILSSFELRENSQIIETI
jgi:hypothetical protein